MTTLVTTDDYATIDDLVAANLTDDIQYQLLTDIVGGNFTGLPAGITIFTENGSKITSDVLSRTEGLALFQVDITGNLSGDNIRIEDSFVNGDYILSLDLNEIDVFITIGNSHTAGRDKEVPGDAFDSRVLQYNGITNAIEYPPTAHLEHNDTNQDPDDFSKDIAFSDAYLADNPDIDHLLFIPYAQGSSGFSTLWDVNGVTGDRLETVVNRANTAVSLMEAQGFTVTIKGVLWHNANPDYNNLTFQEHQEQIDGFVDYVRDNLVNGENVPVVIGGGMLELQLSGRPVNDVRYSSNLAGAGFRRKNVMGYDVVNPQYGLGAADGIPLQTISTSTSINDTIHANRASDIIKGRDLQYPALLRAIEKNNVNGVFEGLTFWDDFYSFYDMRSGTGLDSSGHGNHLIDSSTNNPPLIDWEPNTQQRAYVNTGSGEDSRYFVIPSFPSGSYTKIVFMKLNDYETMGLMQDSEAATEAQEHRMQISGTGSLITAGQGEATQLSASSSLIPLDTHTLICVTFDSSNNSMSLTVGDTVVDTASGVPDNNIVSGYLGNQADGGNNSLDGAISIAGFVDRALTITEIQELNAACQTLIV